MNKTLARDLIKEHTFEDRNACWIPNTKARSCVVDGETFTYSNLLVIGWGINKTAKRPYRLCENSWCYNPKHLLFNELDRFDTYLDKTNINGCWTWTKATDGGGYGVFISSMGREKTHRFAWRLHYGEIPEGMLVCHKCDNPPCCNPKHLFLGTNLSNMEDKVNKNRQSRMLGIMNGRAQITPEIVIQMRKDYESGKMSYRDLVNKYNISQTQVARIIKRESWSWVYA